jgi:transcriptional regulator with XRE-family HTH domain
MQRHASLVHGGRGLKQTPMKNCIKETREALGMDQKTFARLMRVDRSTVYRWESFQLDPSLAQLTRMAKILQTLPGILVPAINHMDPPHEERSSA